MNERTFGFHAKDGWTFLRLPDGAVEISKRMPTYDNEHEFNGFAFIERVTLDVSTWASIVASMSAAGETGETYEAAMILQQGRAS